MYVTMIKEEQTNNQSSFFRFSLKNLFCFLSKNFFKKKFKFVSLRRGKEGEEEGN